MPGCVQALCLLTLVVHAAALRQDDDEEDGLLENEKDFVKKQKTIVKSARAEEEAFNDSSAGVDSYPPMPYKWRYNTWHSWYSFSMTRQQFMNVMAAEAEKKNQEIVYKLDGKEQDHAYDASDIVAELRKDYQLKTCNELKTWVGDVIPKSTPCSEWKDYFECSHHVKVECYASKAELMTDRSWCEKEEDTSIPDTIQGLFWMKDCSPKEREVAFCGSRGAWLEGKGKGSLILQPAYNFVFEDSPGGRSLVNSLLYDSKIRADKLVGSPHATVTYEINFYNSETVEDGSGEDASTKGYVYAKSGIHGNVRGSLSTIVSIASGLVGDWSFVARDTVGNIWDRYVRFGKDSWDAYYQAARLYGPEPDSYYNAATLRVDPETHKYDEDKGESSYKKTVGRINRALSAEGTENIYNFQVQSADKVGNLQFPAAEYLNNIDLEGESVQIKDIKAWFNSDYPQPNPQNHNKKEDMIIPQFFRVIPEEGSPGLKYVGALSPRYAEA